MLTCGYNLFIKLKHKEPHKAHEIERNYHFRMDTMLGKGKCELICISCVWILIKNNMDNQWVTCATD